MIKSILCTLAILLLTHVPVQAKVAEEQIYKQHPLKAVDSVLRVKVGEKAPDFTLPAISGNKVIIGISADNIPSLYAWTTQMSEDGLWFPVLSDFYPHGEAAKKYGIL
ncbi:peroxiredoxin, partial [Aduncisulcus paluster]